MRTHTYTYVTLEVSESTYNEISDKLRAAQYDHCFDGETIDMHGIALELEEKPEDEPTTNKTET